MTELFDNQVVPAGNKDFAKQNTMGVNNNYFLKQSEIDEFHLNEMQVQVGQQQVRMTNVHYNRVMVFEFINVFFATYGLTLSIIMYESKGSSFYEQNEGILLYYNAFCTFALVVSTYLKYKVQNAWFVARGLHTEFDDLLSTGWWKSLTLEVVLLLISPYPYLNNVYYREYLDQYGIWIEYKLNDLLMCFGFIRIYILLRCLLVASKFMNPRSKRVCFMNNCEANLLFSLKAYMK
jgi:hypothetical protein